MCGKKLSKRWKKSERRYRVKFTDSGAYLRALKRSRLLYLFSRYCQSLFFNAAHRSLKLRWAQEIRPAFGMMSSCSWKGRIWNPDLADTRRSADGKGLSPERATAPLIREPFASFQHLPVSFSLLKFHFKADTGRPNHKHQCDYCPPYPPWRNNRQD